MKWIIKRGNDRILGVWRDLSCENILMTADLHWYAEIDDLV